MLSGIYSILMRPEGGPGLLLAMGVKGFLLLATAWAASAALRRRSAATRHLVWATALAGLAALPLMTLVAPRVEVAVLPAEASATAKVTDPAEAPSPALPEPTRTGEAHAAEATAVADAEAGHEGAGTATTAVSSERPLETEAREEWLSGHRVASVPTRNTNWASVAVAAWAAGVFVTFVPVIAGAAMLMRMSRGSRPVTEGRWFTLLGELLGKLESRHPVRLMFSERAKVPMTWGFVRPVVMLPAEAEGWPRERMRVVLLHELSHVGRWDYLTQVTARVACSLHWFDPLAWMGLRKMLALREQACDDSVLNAGEKASEYAEHIVEIARSARATRAAAAAILMARSPRIERRIAALVDAASVRRIVTMKDSVLCICLALCVVGPIAAATLAAETTVEAGTSERIVAQPTAPDAPAEPTAASAAPVADDAVVLKNDDGTQESKQSVAGGTHLVRFEAPTGEWYLTAVEMYGSRYGTPMPPKENWQIALRDKDRKNARFVVKPYSLLERGEPKWHRIEVPTVKLPEGAFWLEVDFDPHSTKGFYMGIDTTDGVSHSMIGDAMHEAASGVQENGDWMVRAVLTQKGATAASDAAQWQEEREATAPPKPSAEAEFIELKMDDGEADGVQSIAGAGPVIRFENELDGAKLAGLTVFASRYGAQFDPAKTYIDWWVLDGDGKVIKQGKTPYGAFGMGRKWVEIDFDDVEVPRQFSVLLNPHAHQTKGIYWAYDSDGEPGEALVGTGPQEEVTAFGKSVKWMVRAYLTAGD